MWILSVFVENAENSHVLKGKARRNRGNPDTKKNDPKNEEVIKNSHTFVIILV